MTEAAAIRVLRCRSGALEWAIAETAVREVAPGGLAARIPGAERTVLGLVSVRGALLAALDSRRILGQPAEVAPGALVVVEVGGRRLVLAVDQVDDLLPVPIETLEPAVPVAGVPERAIIARVGGTPPFLLLDVETLVAPYFPTAAGKP